MKNWILLLIGCSVSIIATSCLNNSVKSQADIKLVFHVQNVESSKISLLPLAGERVSKPVAVIDDVRPGLADTLYISKYYLPAEFELKIEYNGDSKTKSFVKYLVVSNQNIELWFDPQSFSGKGNIQFQKGEKENTVLSWFLNENEKKIEPLKKFQQRLNDNGKAGIDTLNENIDKYEKARQEYNHWIDRLVHKYQTLFVRSILEFQKIPKTDWKGEKTGNGQILRDTYFDDLNLNDSLIARTPGMKIWMDRYVELFTEPTQSGLSNDSALLLAGQKALGKVQMENPQVYGWVAEYFLKKYETHNLQEGIKMLQSHFNNTDCLTPYKRVIQQRISESEKLIPGLKTPDFYFIDKNGKYTFFRNYKTKGRFKLILFWNTDCWECIAFSNKLYSWYQHFQNKDLVEVFAINLDPEIPTEEWGSRINEMPEWNHMIDDGGIESEVANAFCVLDTPTMILIDVKTNKIISCLNAIEELNAKIY